MIKPVSKLLMNDLIDYFKLTIRSKDYITYETNNTHRMLETDLFYRADYFGIILILDGSIQYTANDKKYSLHGGDALFCVPSETFKITNYSDDFRAQQIFFSVHFISDAGFNYKSNDIIKSLSSSPSNVIIQQRELFQRMKFHVDQLAFLNSPDVHYYYFNEMMWCHFSLLMYEIYNYFKESNMVLNTTSREEEITTVFFTLVREHFKEHHDVKFYADKLFITRKYLSRVIGKTMFKTPREIINQVLLIEAKLILNGSTSNVAQVAEELNFSNQAIFSKFFKKHTGITPSEYKKTDLF